MPCALFAPERKIRETIFLKGIKMKKFNVNLIVFVSYCLQGNIN